MSTTVVPVDDVVDALTREWAAIDTVVATLTDAEWQSPSILPGWSVADIVAHVVGTENMLAGRDVDPTRDVAALDHVHNEIGELNEKWLDHFRGRPRSEVMDAFHETIGVRTQALRAMSQDDFVAESFTPAGPDTYGRFMRIRIFDCWIHEIDIRDSVGRAGELDPAPTRWALEEIAASLPFVIGKRARTPKGTSVLLRIGGAAPRDVRIAVADRAAVVESFPGGDDAADVTLTLDAADLARFVGGRTSAVPERVTITGDDAIGRAIVENFAYVI